MEVSRRDVLKVSVGTATGTAIGGLTGLGVSLAPILARAMALDVLAEWRLAMSSPAFGDWLARGAPSDDRPERSEST